MFGIQNKYFSRVCPLRLSPPPGPVWLKYYATLNSVFHVGAIIQAAPFCTPAGLFLFFFFLYKCDFSEICVKHYSSLFFILTIN